MAGGGYSIMQLELDKIICVNTFAYPDEYPKCMTDWGMYAFFLACKHSLIDVVVIDVYCILPTS